MQDRPIYFTIIPYRIFINKTSDSTSQLTIKILPIFKFTCIPKKNVHNYLKVAIKYFFFSTTYLGEARFSLILQLE